MAIVWFHVGAFYVHFFNIQFAFYIQFVFYIQFASYVCLFCSICFLCSVWCVWMSWSFLSLLSSLVYFERFLKYPRLFIWPFSSLSSYYCFSFFYLCTFIVLSLLNLLVIFLSSDLFYQFIWLLTGKFSSEFTSSERTRPRPYLYRPCARPLPLKGSSLIFISLCPFLTHSCSCVL